MKFLDLGLGAIFGAMMLAAPAQSAVWTNVWSTNFNNNVVFQTMGPFGYDTASYTAGGAAFTNSQSLPGFGTRYLRNAGTGTTSFAFTGLDWHRALKLDFDLAFLDSRTGRPTRAGVRTGCSSRSATQPTACRPSRWARRPRAATSRRTATGRIRSIG